MKEIQEEPTVEFEDAIHEEPQRLVAREMLTLYGANNEKFDLS